MFPMQKRHLVVQNTVHRQTTHFLLESIKALISYRTFSACVSSKSSCISEKQCSTTPSTSASTSKSDTDLKLDPFPNCRHTPFINGIRRYFSNPTEIFSPNHYQYQIHHQLNKLRMISYTKRKLCGQLCFGRQVT